MTREEVITALCNRWLNGADAASLSRSLLKIGFKGYQYYSNAELEDDYNSEVEEDEKARITE